VNIMADQNEGAIPPKVSPITPHNAAPGAPRPITIHLHSVSGGPAATPVTSAVNPHATSRVPLPEGIAASAATHPATIRLRPVSAVPPATPVKPAPHAPGSTQSIAHMEAPASPEPELDKTVKIVAQAAPVPGSSPIPEGPKPPSAAQIQASKSKTSRISLDAAIGAAPADEHTSPKTIRLKRPTDLPSAVSIPAQQPAVKPVAARQTSRIPVDEALPEEGATVTQKKTLKIKRPNTADTRSQEIAQEKAEGLIPIEELEPKKTGSAVFTAIALAVSAVAAVVMILLCLCLGAHAMGPDAGKNSLATINGPALPWIGK
jgi:hypothetical protein